MGGYAAGVIEISTITELYLFIGAHSKDFDDSWENHFKIAYNGGGYAFSSPGGGGGTDIRLNYNGKMNDENSLHSRIIVSGGGGGSDCLGYGGGGGGLIGGNGIPGANGGTQNYGGEGNPNGGLWIGGYSNTENAAGGGGGYYGGGYGKSLNQGGGGGSSYVYGYPFCKEINDSRYGKNKFRRATMIRGGDGMPSPYSEIQLGHEGHGAARITIISDACPSIYRFNLISFATLYTYVLIVCFDTVNL